VSLAASPKINNLIGQERKLSASFVTI